MLYFFCEGRYIPGRLSGVDEAGISKKYTRSTQGESTIGLDTLRPCGIGL